MTASPLHLARACVLAIAIATLAAAQSPWPAKPIKIIAPVQPGGGVDLVARTVADRLGARARPADRRREPERRRRRRRLARDRARGARRLHADGRLRRHARHQSGRAQAAVRRDQGLHADRDGRRHAERAGRAAVAAGEDARRNSSPTRRRIRASSRTARRARARSRISRWSSSRSPPTSTSCTSPYRGIGPAITDILGGQTQALFPGLAAALPHIKAGKMRPLAVTGTQRHPLLPDVPTFEELGYKGFDGVQWYGIVGPANLPAPIVKRLNDEINKMLAEPGAARAAVRRSAGADADVARAVRASTSATTSRSWSKLAKERNIQIDRLMAHNTDRRGGHRRPAGHPHPRRVRRGASVARLERRASTPRRIARS